MNTYCVYVHTNKVNGKKYVGITSALDPNKRWGDGKGYSTRQPAFHAAIRKYGWENFDHEILLTGLTHYMACKMESYYIEKLETYINEHPDKGYNMTKGGEGKNKGRNCYSKDYQKRMYDEDPQKYITIHKSWAQRHPERIKEYSKNWYARNKEKALAYSNNWKKNNPEKVKEIARKIREKHKAIKNQ